MLTGKEDIVRAITEALALEKGTREFYQFAASKVKDKSAKDIFSVLRDMEERHMRYLDFLYLAVSEDRDLLGYKDFSSSVTATHIESGVSASDAVKLFEEQEIKTAKDALKVAFRIESQAHGLYMKLAETAADPEVTVIFEEMVAQELKHVEYLKELEKNI